MIKTQGKDELESSAEKERREDTKHGGYRSYRAVDMNVSLHELMTWRKRMMKATKRCANESILLLNED